MNSKTVDFAFFYPYAMYHKALYSSMTYHESDAADQAAPRNDGHFLICYWKR
jgi:hypothetical protein